MAGTREPLAIVGIGCRFPGAVDSPESYWRRLCEGFDVIRRVPPDRWDSRLHHSRHFDTPRKIVFDAGGFVEQPLDQFDAHFFGITAREAAVLDPQQRLLLEVTWECFEDALVRPEAWEGSQTGVFVGSFAVDHGIIQQGYLNLDMLGASAATGATSTMLAARLSYSFDLRGPCVSMDTACSASLVAFHYACQSIWNGECEAALAGGASVMLSPTAAIPPSKGHFFSPDSRSRAFDARANGYGRGEGAAVVLLRPLSVARAAGDRIHALVVATGVNHDGRTPGVAVPSRQAQSALLRRVHTEAGNLPVQYLEAHGTGTPLGDPTELEGLSEGLRLSRERPLYVGSVKANMGHLEAAAGIAGLIKAALALRHGKIPPHVGMTQPNPKIAFDELGVRIPQVLTDWPAHEGPARAGVNSFGYGGTNAHVVLQRAEPEPLETPEGVEPHASAAPLFLPLSARDPKALEAVARGMLDWVRRERDHWHVADLVHTSVRDRSHHHHRMAVVARTFDELEANLREHVESGSTAGIARGEAPYGAAPELVFVYTGMGPQTWAMGRELRRQFAVFRDAFTDCLERFSTLAGRSLFAEIEAHADEVGAPRTATAQWLNFALQVGLTQLWRSWGVEPAAVVGHSVGEVAAAWAAGALDIGDALRVAYERGRLQETVEGTGGMLAVELDAASFAALELAGADHVQIAAFNAPRSITLAGPSAELEAIQRVLDERGVFSRALHVRVPYHSSAMDPLHDEFLAEIAGIVPRQPVRRLVSTVTGDATGPRDAVYWWRNVREPVQFQRAIDTAFSGKHHVALQIGPHAVLTPALKACLAARFQDAPVLHSLHRQHPEARTVLEALGALYASGVALDWERIAPHGRRAFSLPHYPWQRERHWQETEASLVHRLGRRGHPLLGQPMPSSAPTWCSEITEGYFGYFQDHRAEDRALFPAAAFLEIGLAVREAVHGPGTARLESVTFHSALVLSEDMRERIEIRYDEKSAGFAVHNRLDSGHWPLLCSGSVSAYAPQSERRESLEEARRDFQRVETPLYLDRTQTYFYYGPKFRSIRELHLKDRQFIAELELPEGTNPERDRYFIHPILLDGALQAAVLTGHTILAGGNPDGIMMPVALDRMDLLGVGGSTGWCRGTIRQFGKVSIEVDLELFDAGGAALATLSGLRWGFLRTRHEPTEQELRSWLYLPAWVEVEKSTRAVAPSRWIVVSRDAQAGAALQRAFENAGYGGTLIVASDPPARSLDAAVKRGDLATAGGIVYVAGGGDFADDDAAAHTEIETNGLLALLQAVLESGADASLRVACVTRGAHALPGEPLEHPEQGALWGLSRAYANEQRGAGVLLLDGPPAPDAESWSRIATELCAAEPRRQSMVRADRVYELRLNGAPRLDRDDREGALPQSVAPTESVTLSLKTPGQIDELAWVKSPRRAPGAQEVELRVEATAVNFKDLMKVTGLISDAVTRGTFLGAQLGMECAGVVTAVGADVRGLEVGDRVVAVTAGSFATYVTCPASSVAPLLPGVDPEQSVVYATFTTVLHALGDVARLRSGETLLIHSAAGALGLAAIQYAKRRGARIFATASTPRKREYLAALGVERVGDSRTLAFRDEVMQWSAGRGVDVVLNFLSGEARLQSLALLAPGGRFVDVGKPGGVPDAQLPARLFNTNMLFANVDLDQLMRDDPRAMQDLAARVVAAFAAKELEPLPTKVFGPNEVQQAFHDMARAEQIGKVVVSFRKGAIELGRSSTDLFRPDRSYLVTGAFGGFGLEICRWLVARGVRHLVMLSRRGRATPGSEPIVAELEAAGARVTALAGDVADRRTVDAVLERIRHELVPLAGVFHAAMVLDDGLLPAMTPERVHRVMQPKVAGAWNLHHATRALGLDHFVLFSSVASVTGGVGQSNYAAANAALDSLAAHRQRLGLPALAIDWGVLSDSGVVARNPELMRLLSSHGMLGLTNDEALAGFEIVLRHPWTQICFMKLDWEVLSAMSPAAGRTPFAAELLKSARPAAAASYSGLAQLNEAFNADPTASLQETAERSVGLLVAAVLHTTAERVEARRPLSAAGVDSLMATELSVALFKQYGVRFAVLDLLRTLSIADIAAQIVTRLEPVLAN